jgi:hypothetical protein
MDPLFFHFDLYFYIVEFHFLSTTSIPSHFKLLIYLDLMDTVIEGGVNTTSLLLEREWGLIFFTGSSRVSFFVPALPLNNYLFYFISTPIYRFCLFLCLL